MVDINIVWLRDPGCKRYIWNLLIYQTQAVAPKHLQFFFLGNIYRCTAAVIVFLQQQHWLQYDEQSSYFIVGVTVCAATAQKDDEKNI